MLLQLLLDGLLQLLLDLSQWHLLLSQLLQLLLQLWDVGGGPLGPVLPQVGALVLLVDGVQLLQLLLDLLEQDVVLLLLQQVTNWERLQLLQLDQLLGELSVAWLLLLLDAPQVLWVLLWHWLAVDAGDLLVLLLLVLLLDLLDLLDQSGGQLLGRETGQLLRDSGLLLLLLDLLLSLGQDLLQLLEQGLELNVLALVLLNELLWNGLLVQGLLLAVDGWVVQVLLLVGDNLVVLAEHTLELADLVHQGLLDGEADLDWDLGWLLLLDQDGGEVLDGLLQSLLRAHLLLDLLENILSVEGTDAVEVGRADLLLLLHLLVLLAVALQVLLHQLLLQTLQDGHDGLDLSVV